MRYWKLCVIIGLIALGAAWFLAGCGGNEVTPKSPTVDLKDGDSYTLSAGYVTRQVAGEERQMLAYNNVIPGPTIRVPQGAVITLNLKNNTDLPTLLHSHGVRMDNAFDGSQLQQKEIQPGESFAYKLRFDDAGVYWYHPHANEVFGQGMGLYGAFIVMSREPEYLPPVNREVPLFLTDIPVNNEGIAIARNKPNHSLMGHYGNIMLLNGEEKYALEAQPGEVVRLYLINAANTRPFNFAVEGARMKLVGGDAGACERAAFVENIILGPSERAIVDVFLPRAGKYEIQNRTPDKTYRLGEIAAGGRPPDVAYEAEFKSLQKSLTTARSIAPFRGLIDREPDKRLVLTLNMSEEMMDHADHLAAFSKNTSGHNHNMSTDLAGIEWEDMNWMMNLMSTPDGVKWKLVDRDTGRENMGIDWTFKRGEPVKIRIFNDPGSMHPMQHPLHFHGQRFLVVARNGQTEEYLVWKDTVMVRIGETVDIILDTANPGEWMAHCHISEHLEAGMMLKFKVE